MDMAADGGADDRQTKWFVAIIMIPGLDLPGAGTHRMKIRLRKGSQATQTP